VLGLAAGHIFYRPHSAAAAAKAAQRGSGGNQDGYELKEPAPCRAVP
jgi:hypothetical protein